jgi:DNA polymerase III subunit beta
MSFTIQKKQFLGMLDVVCPVAPVKSSLQILSNIKLMCKSKLLTAIATDLDQSVLISSEVTGKDSFDVAVNARKLYDVVREIPEGNIFGEVDETVLILRSEHGFSCKIAGTDPNDFPAIPDVGEGISFEINVSDFSRLVSRSSFAVSKDTSRSCLCGVLWEIKDGKTTMVATDGHRLGCCSMKQESTAKEAVSAIIPPKTLLHLQKIESPDKIHNTLSVTIGKKYVQFRKGGISLCAKLIDGPYPDYDKVIPKNNPKIATIEKAALIDAVRRVSILSSQKTHLVKFQFKKNSLETVVLNKEIGGEARDAIPIVYDADDHAVGLNGQYLSEILSIIDAPKVRLEMNTQISACLIFPLHAKKAEDKTDDLFLIMPLRIMEDM